jgi:hypothetical protein
MLNHRIPPVSEILAPYVEHLWVVRGYLPARWRNIILPDGAMELIVNLGDRRSFVRGIIRKSIRFFDRAGSQASGARRS